MARKYIIYAHLLCVLLAGACNNPTESRHQTGSDTLFKGAQFEMNVRPTEALSPEEERKGFLLPEGFEISLFASEPDIGKPMNITWDAKGRMWVTQSFEYPFPATPGKGRDRVSILEDLNNDGRADTFTHFADTLNIPIGVIPHTDGATVFSIPSVTRYTDTNNDGQPESAKKLFGPFDYRDTHGMVNNFTIGYDGWIYACHGFSNISTVAGSDGDSIHLDSGNTIRFLRNGKRIEHHTVGRINPFGLAFDEMGYLYSSDCHSSPIYQLIPGAEYYHWGRDEGMGFGPDVKPFEDEATALAGLAYYADNHFPAAFQKNLFIGDAVASRVYRNSLTFNGTTPVGKREADFLLSNDPWFRPVDVKMGPDGALYIADFYNSIIGHYEVPLDHPKRDRIRGRIWRITYKGKTNAPEDLSTASVESLLAAFTSPNLPVRMMAADQLVERIGSPAINAVQQFLRDPGKQPQELVHGLWVLQRLNGLTEEWMHFGMRHPSPLVRLHTTRILGEMNPDSPSTRELLETAVGDRDLHVQRAAIENLHQFPSLAAVRTLSQCYRNAGHDDTHLRYTIRLQLRNILRLTAVMKNVLSESWSRDDAALIASVLPGVQTAEAGTLLLKWIGEQKIPAENLPKAYLHIARFIPDVQLKQAVEQGKKTASSGNTASYQIFRSFLEGFEKRGLARTTLLHNWGRQTALNLFNDYRSRTDTAAQSQQQVDAVHFAADIAGRYRITELSAGLSELAGDTSLQTSVRTTALRSLLKIDANRNVALAAELLSDPENKPAFKKSIIALMGESGSSQAIKVLAGIRQSPPDIQREIAIALASSKTGKDILLNKVKKGELFPRILKDAKVEERLLINSTPAQQRDWENLTKNLDKADSKKQAIIRNKVSDYEDFARTHTLEPVIAQGRQVFTNNCAPCHSINGAGGAIGPQLDGVGRWGSYALAEKILDPNRNISENFKTYTITLQDGKLLTGLYRRDEGAVEVFADINGTEFSVPKKDIVGKQTSKTTLMPDQFIHTLSDEAFIQLMAYLTAQQ